MDDYGRGTSLTTLRSGKFVTWGNVLGGGLQGKLKGLIEDIYGGDMCGAFRDYCLAEPAWQVSPSLSPSLLPSLPPCHCLSLTPSRSPSLFSN